MSSASGDGANADVMSIRREVDAVLAARGDAIAPHVIRCVSEALGIPVGELPRDAALIPELGAESIDVLELVFKLETAFDIGIPRNGILAAVRQGLGDKVVRGGRLSAEAVERLRILMPEIAAERFDRPIDPADITELFTVNTFIRLVAWRQVAPVPASDPG